MKIVELKYKIEKKFRKIKVHDDCWGFQVQPNTKFCKGISRKEIDELERLFGFEFPWLYREMLLTFTGFDKPLISIDPENGAVEYDNSSFFYHYPYEFEKSKWLVEEIKDNYKEALFVINEAGFDASKIVGFVPIHNHRALVVFKDKYLSPVISVVGADIILYGDTIINYLKNEFINS